MSSLVFGLRYKSLRGWLHLRSPKTGVFVWIEGVSVSDCKERLTEKIGSKKVSELEHFPTVEMGLMDKPYYRGAPLEDLNISELAEGKQSERIKKLGVLHYMDDSYRKLYTY